MQTPQCDPTDLTEPQWQQREPLLPLPKKRGRPPVDPTPGSLTFLRRHRTSGKSPDGRGAWVIWEMSANHSAVADSHQVHPHLLGEAQRQFRHEAGGAIEVEPTNVSSHPIRSDP